MQEFVDTVADRVFEAGFCSNQASVKYLIEWMMVLILVYYPHHMDKFWTCFSKVKFHSRLTCKDFVFDWIISSFSIDFDMQDHEKTKTSSCTFLSVLVHLNVIIPKLQDQVYSRSVCSNSNRLLSCFISFCVSPVCL